MYTHHEPVMIELQMRERLNAAEQPILLERLVFALIESLLKWLNSAGRGLIEQQQEHRLPPDAGFPEWVTK